MLSGACSNRQEKVWSGSAWAAQKCMKLPDYLYRLPKLDCAAEPCLAGSVQACLQYTVLSACHVLHYIARLPYKLREDAPLQGESGTQPCCTDACTRLACWPPSFSKLPAVVRLPLVLESAGR